MRGGCKVFPPILQPPDGPLKFTRHGWNQNFLGIDHLFAPETAAKPRGRHSYFLQINSKCARQNRAQHLRKLGATFDVQSLAVIDQLRRDPARFERNRGLPVELEPFVDHEIAFTR